MTDQELIAEWQDRADAHEKAANEQSSKGNIYGEMSHHGSCMAYNLVLYELRNHKFVFRQNKPVPPDPNWVYPQQDYTEINP